MERRSKLRAVVADDTAVTRHQIERCLTELGIEVVASVENGIKALQACLVHNPDVLLLDLVMPELSGVDVIRLLRTRLPTRIVVITSHCDRALHARCLALGAFTVLIKPVGLEEMQQLLTGPSWQ